MSSGSGQSGKTASVSTRPACMLTNNTEQPRRPPAPSDRAPSTQPTATQTASTRSKKNPSPKRRELRFRSSLRPSYSRTSTYDSAANGHRDDSPARRLTRIPTDPTLMSSSRSNLRPVRQSNAFADEYEEDYAASNGHRRDRSPPSPDRSSQASQGSGSVMSRAASWSAADLGSAGKKAPPPPPPSRAKKPPPPPPPMKRSALSASELARY
jgi:hypothetical protein